MQKLCVFCQNYEWSEPYTYSEYTAGGGYFTCMKSHEGTFWSTGDSLEQYRGAILTAEKCPDYEQVEVK